MIRWRTGIDDVAVQRIRQLADHAAGIDGVAPISGHVLDNLAGMRALMLDDRGGDLLGRNDNAGQLAAVAVHHDQDPVEFVVAPCHRRRGLGRFIAGMALESGHGMWAHGNLPAAQALAASLGMTAGRTLLQQRRLLPADVTATLPPGVTLRTFVPGQDDEEFLGVNARAFAWHPEQGRLDAAGLADEFAQGWFDSNGFFLAVADGDHRILGFHWTKVHQIDPTPAASLAGTGDSIGEIYVLGVDPESPIRGLGGPLTGAGLDYLTERGINEVMLYVEGDNAPALRLYQRFGFAAAVTDVVYR